MKRNPKITRSRFALLLIAAVMLLPLGGCAVLAQNNEAAEDSTADTPKIPDHLERNAEGIPVLKVYNTATDAIEEMDLESYIMGVVAGEMKNDWPMEALKAQAILARTFTMKFVESKKSGYEGADISTDVHEAQAYDSSAINDRVREAVNETSGIVLTAGGEFPYAWFHAHAGGMTELPSRALEYKDDPAYLTVVESTESDKAPEDVKQWTVSFSKDEALKACADSGLKLDSIESFEIGEKGESGRAVNFLVNGQKVSAPSFRLHIGSSRLKSTLIHEINVDDNSVTFSGSGFGHGVGMSQWGAYEMAEKGSTAEEIVHHYFSGTKLEKLW